MTEPVRMHPVNLILRGLLELGALMAIGYWAWGLGGWIWAALAIGLFVLIWGVFNVPGDPSRGGGAPVRVPGLVRLCLEIVLFAWAFFALGGSGWVTLSKQFGNLLILHYILSWRRVLWLVSAKSDNADSHPPKGAQNLNSPSEQNSTDQNSGEASA